MWSVESKKRANESSKVFDDLKIFDTLEPEKVETFDGNVTTALLVDVSGTDVPDTKLLGSFLDVKKQEFTLVDLFENLYVTPQHVANKNDLDDNFFDLDNTDAIKSTTKDVPAKEDSLGSVKENSIKHDSIKDSKRTFDEIFDSAVSSRFSKLDFKSRDVKSGDCVDGFKFETSNTPTHYSIPTKVLIPPKCNFNVASDEKVINSTTLNGNYHYDTTNDYLLEKTYVERENVKVNDKYEDFEILRPPIVQNYPKPCLFKRDDAILAANAFQIEKNDNNTNTKIDDKLINTPNDSYNSKANKVLFTNTNVHTQSTKETKTPFNAQGNSKDICNCKNSEVTKDILNNNVYLQSSTSTITPLKAQGKSKDIVDCNIFNIPKVKLESLKVNENKAKRNIFESDPVTRYRRTITSQIVDLNKQPIVKNNTIIPVLQSIKKDAKAYNRRRVVKKDSEKIGYTKGPDIYEKSVVLPQIIERLNERRIVLDASSNVKRKLVLDRGRNDNVPMPKLSPEVLIEDCNKERLKALKLRTAFENFVVSGHF